MISQATNAVAAAELLVQDLELLRKAGHSVTPGASRFSFIVAAFRLHIFASVRLFSSNPTGWKERKAAQQRTLQLQGLDFFCAARFEDLS